MEMDLVMGGSMLGLMFSEDVIFDEGIIILR